VQVPVIDLAGYADGTDARRSVIAAQVDQACRRVGFLSVLGHGVADDVGYPHGYRGFSVEALNRSIGGAAPPDLKETMNIGPIREPSTPGSPTTRRSTGLLRPGAFAPARIPTTAR
jgi:hypothetical protein